MRGEQSHCEELGRELREVSGSPPRKCVSFRDVLSGEDLLHRDGGL